MSDDRIKRWSLFVHVQTNGEMAAELIERPDGYYVTYDDHRAAMEAKDARIRELEEACAGMENPAYEIAKMREAMYLLKIICSNYQKHLNIDPIMFRNEKYYWLVVETTIRDAAKLLGVDVMKETR